jgi:hypothetical protein
MSRPRNRHVAESESFRRDRHGCPSVCAGTFAVKAETPEQIAGGDLCVTPMLRLFLFLGIVTTALASVTLDALEHAAQRFSIAIDQQWTIAQSDPSPATLAESTIANADAKISYCTALRAAMPGLANIATGRE